MRIFYRVRQFWRAVFLKTDSAELEQVQGRLSAAQWTLFSQMQPSEQAHAISICDKLISQGDSHPDLLVAALLHDAGKLRYRLNPFERSLVVVVQALLPSLARRWGQLPSGDWQGLPGWRKTFILAAHHAEWGAELAHQAGVSTLTEALIRNHQRRRPMGADEQEYNLLNKLRVVDDDS